MQLKDIRSYIYVRNFYNIINISSTFDGGSIYIFKGLKMVSIKISYLLFFLLCISPPTDIDSIDYHLGAPATWYEYKSFYSRKDWLHYRFTGLGEYINIIGIYLKTFNFGQLIQFFSLKLQLLQI